MILCDELNAELGLKHVLHCSSTCIDFRARTVFSRKIVRVMSDQRSQGMLIFYDKSRHFLVFDLTVRET